MKTEEKDEFTEFCGELRPWDEAEVGQLAASLADRLGPLVREQVDPLIDVSVRMMMLDPGEGWEPRSGPAVAVTHPEFPGCAFGIDVHGSDRKEISSRREAKRLIKACRRFWEGKKKTRG